MKKKKLVAAMLVMSMAAMLFTACKGVTTPKNEFKAEHFKLTMPEELNGTYDAEVEGDSISIYDKANRENNGGYVFSVSAYKETAQWADGNMITKVGELETADGTVYDMVLEQPSDVQYDLEDESAQASYMAIADSVQYLSGVNIPTVTGINNADGSFLSTYAFGYGIHGKDLYGDIIAKHITAIEEGWDAVKLEAEGMSSMYALLGNKAMERVGYTYYDINEDGIDELFIGEIADGEWKGIIYDMYTMVDRVPAHVVSGYDRDRYFAGKNYIVEEYSNGAAESGVNISYLRQNAAELIPGLFFKEDGYEDEENPYFISYDGGETYDATSKDEYETTLSNFLDYNRFDYTALADYSTEEAADSIDKLPDEAAQYLPEGVSAEAAAGTDSIVSENGGNVMMELLALFGLTAFIACFLIIYLLEVIGLWKIFTKMGEAGWKSLIPVYNEFILFKNTWTSGAFWVSFILVIVGGVMTGGAEAGAYTAINYIGAICALIGGLIRIILSWKLVKSFGKGVGYFIFMLILPEIAQIVLGFSGAEYLGNSTYEDI